MRQVKAYLLLFLLVAVSSASAAVTKIEASVDRRAIAMNEVLTLTVAVHNLDPDMVDFRRGSPDYTVTATSSSKSFRLINGKSDKSITYKYVIKPKHEGSMVLPSVIVRAGPITHTTDPLTIQVGPAKATKPKPSLPKIRRAPKNSAPVRKPIAQPKEDVFARFELSDTKPYPNEQISLRLKVYHRGNLRSLNMEPLQLDDFILERDDKALEYKETIDGFEFFVYEFSFVLFPVKAGETAIPASSISAIVLEDRKQMQLDPFRFMNPFMVERERDLLIPELVLQVQELPAGAPKEFTGYVGELAVVHELKDEAMLSGEAVSLETRINGDGNVATLSPELVQESKLYSLFGDKENVVTAIEDRHRYFEATKTTAIIPRKDKGKISIKTKPLVSFNPKTNKYETHGKNKFQLDVMPNPNLAVPAGPPAAQSERAPVKEPNETILSIPSASILTYTKQPVRNRDLILAIILINFLAFCVKAWRYLQGFALPEQEANQSIGAYVKKMKAADEVAEISKLLREVAQRVKQNQELETKLVKFFEESDRVNYSMQADNASSEQLEYFRKQALELMKELAHAK